MAPFVSGREKKAIEATNEKQFASPNFGGSNSWQSEADEVNKEGRISQETSEGTDEKWGMPPF